MAKKIWIGGNAGGANDWSVGANWSGGTVPVNGDDAYILNSVAITAGLDQHLVTLSSLHISLACGLIGTASAYMQVGCTKLDIGEYAAAGRPATSGRIKVDTGTAASTIVVHDSGTTPTDSNLPVVRVLTGHATSQLHVRKGSVGLACESPAETSTLASVSIGYQSSVLSDADVVIGEGVTLTSLTKYGGKVLLKAAATTIINWDGTLTVTGNSAIDTLRTEGGTVYPLSTGAISHVRFNGGLTDFTKSSVARTIADAIATAGSMVAYDPAVLTITGGLQTSGPVRVAVSAA